MTAKLIQGKEIAAEIHSALELEIAPLLTKGITPCLHSVQVGENPSSRLYLKKQRETCEQVGIKHITDELPPDITEKDLLKHLETLGNDPEIHGIVLQMPLPEHLNSKRMQMSIPADKDVEGLTPENLGYIMYGTPGLVPCTAKGAFEIIKSTGIDLRGKEAVVVGCSVIVGRPLAMLLLDEYCTTQICRSTTKDLKGHCLTADILVAATGRPELIKGDWVKEGAVVIDVGVNREPILDSDGQQLLNEKGRPRFRTVGDVEFEKAKERAALITPVPGGVGPMTVIMLLKNVVDACKQQNGLK